MRKLSVLATMAVSTVAACTVAAQELPKSHIYDFRESAAYHDLDELTRKRLEKVVDDLDLIKHSLNAYMKDHSDSPPKKLEDLVPRYLKRLPVDPFSAKDTSIPKHLKHFERSLNGRGYLYCHKPSGHSIKSYHPLEFHPKPGAWDIRSIGLRKFPLRYQVSNPGLIRTRGYWGRLQLDVF